MSDGDGEIFLRGPAGRIEALWKPSAREHARAAAVVCHPHPLHGGTMYNKVAYRAGRALHAAGLSVLRFNFRGVGGSEGSFDGGRGERDDVTAMIDHLAETHDDILVAGFSFGAWVGLDVGMRDARVRRLVGLGLPANVFDFGYLQALAKPALILHGDRDSWGSLDHVRAVAEAAHAELHVLDGADHFFEGHLDALMDVITAFAART
ncbi:Alpha/beta hydrolase [Minicystis rosea]|nr:Alpha/beta hydrolase [Minicystis rosea]